jgi:transcriptional regulator with XRE-family HTH domain
MEQGEAIRELRKRLQLTPREFAEKIGVSEITIARSESGFPTYPANLAGLHHLAIQEGHADLAKVFQDALKDKTGPATEKARKMVTADVLEKWMRIYTQQVEWLKQMRAHETDEEKRGNILQSMKEAEECFKELGAMIGWDSVEAREVTDRLSRAIGTSGATGELVPTPSSKRKKTTT